MKKMYSLVYCMLCYTALDAQNCSPATAFDFIDINNVKARINNGGDMWWDLLNSAEYVVPKTGNVSSLFAGAIWIGGLDNGGTLHMAAQTYRQNGNDFFPGPLDASGNVTFQACTDFDRVWKVNKATIDSFTSGLFAAPPSSIAQWPGKNNPNLPFLPNQDLAPFIDVNTDGTYNSADGDYPAIPGDQALWFVFNDKGNIHSETGGAALGIEVQCLVYGFKDPDACTYSTTFYHYRITNKSTNSYDSVYIGLWADPDLGCYTDDYIGCDSINSLGIVYNSTATDASVCSANYGNQPPVLAIQTLKGPVDDNGTIHYMDHFMNYVNDFSAFGNPQNALDYYLLMQSKHTDGTHLTNPLTGAPINYAYPSDPPDPNGWSMCAINALPSDIRMLTTCGPSILKSKQTQTMDYAVLWDNSSIYPCPAFATIDSVAACTKSIYLNDIQFTGEAMIASPQQNLSVFPNPCGISSMLHFSMQGGESIEIFDIAGRKVFNADIKNRTSLSLNASEIGKGFFIYIITSTAHNIQSGKLLVQ